MAFAAPLITCAPAALAARTASHRAASTGPSPLLRAFTGAPIASRQRCARAAVVARPAVVAAASTGSAETIKLNIQGRKLEVTDSLREYIEEKVLSAVAAFQGAIKSVDVTLSVRGGDTGTKGPVSHKVDVTVRTLRTGVVRVEDSEENMYAAVDLVCDKVSRSIRKTKEKAMARGKWAGHAGQSGSPVINDVLDSQDVVDELPIYKEATLPEEVIRSKYFMLEPMTIAEACEQLEAVDHDFFIFQDAETKAVQVVYKRNTRGYGHIVPMLPENN